MKPKIEKLIPKTIQEHFEPKTIPRQIEPNTIPKKLDPKTIHTQLEPKTIPEQSEPNKKLKQLEPRAIPAVPNNIVDDIKVVLPNTESIDNNMDQAEFQKSATESAATSDERVRNAKFT